MQNELKFSGVKQSMRFWDIRGKYVNLANTRLILDISDKVSVVYVLGIFKMYDFAKCYTFSSMKFRYVKLICYIYNTTFIK